jgi:hypothetical protein
VKGVKAHKLITPKIKGDIDINVHHIKGDIDVDAKVKIPKVSGKFGFGEKKTKRRIRD